MSNKFHVKIGDIEFTLEGDADYIERERSVFFGNVLPQAVDAMTRTKTIQLPSALQDISEPSALLTTDQKTTMVELSVNEFLNEKRFGSQIDIALGLIYYWEKYFNQTEVTSESLKSYFQTAKEPVPQNTSLLIHRLTQKGHIQHIATNPKNYTITRSGNKYIEDYQPNEKKEIKTVTYRKARSKQTSTYSGLNREELHLEKYPSTQSLKDFKDKMMLSLYIITTEEKGKKFTTTDVVYILTDIFGEKATISQVNGVFHRNPRWFNETSDAENKKTVWRNLLDEGMNYASTLCKGSEGCSE